MTIRILLLVLGAAVACGACADEAGTAAPSSAAGQGGSPQGGAAGQPSAGSGGSGATGGAAGSGGEVSPRPLGVLPLYYGGGGVPFVPVAEGAVLNVRLPPQGGFVLWIGAEVRPVTAAHLDIRGRLRSKATGAIVAEESRTIAVVPVAPGEDRVHPFPVSIRNATNLPVCPNYGEEELLGVPLELEVRIEDPSTSPPGLGIARLGVTLGCIEGSYGCVCECSLGYILGQCSASPEIPPEF
jgi:hypothetical protein